MSSDTDPQFGWQDAHPVSERFDDVYYNRANGLAETRYVFLEGCQIPEVLSGTPRPVIGELGFGTGLNAAATFHVWNQARAHNKVTPEGYLHYISVEGFPLTRDQVAAALGPWRTEVPEVDWILDIYPQTTPNPGFQRFWLPEHRVCLTLLIGDALEMLSELHAHMDAWYLDGFSPAKNPGMWSPEIMGHVARLSRPGAKAATFTAAGHVRRGLAAAGFSVERRAGFAGKRHMTIAERDQTSAPVSDPRPAWLRFSEAPPKRFQPTIVGAGIAGACVARSLLDRGITPKVIEAEHHVAAGASGNAAGLVKAKLEVSPTPGALWQQRAFDYAARTYTRWPSVTEWSGCLDVHIKDQDTKRARKLAASDHIPEGYVKNLSQDTATTETGLSLTNGGSFQPFAGWVSPPALIAHLFEGAQVTLGHSTHEVDTSTPTIWCAGWQSWHQQDISDALSMAPRKGQITTGRVPSDVTLKMPLSGSHYIIPQKATTWVIGATFDPVSNNEDALKPIDEADQRNAQVLTDFIQSPVEWEVIDHRVSVRATTPDHLPYAGPVPDGPWSRAAYAEIHLGKKALPLPDLQPLDHLWILSGLGSRGLTTAPLAAELVVSQLLGDPWPVAISEAQRLAPIRDIIRNLK